MARKAKKGSPMPEEVLEHFKAKKKQKPVSQRAVKSAPVESEPPTPKPARVEPRPAKQSIPMSLGYAGRCVLNPNGVIHAAGKHSNASAR